MSALPSVSIVVVNWNGRHLLESCLPALAALDYPRDHVETIVFDNGSEDGSVEWLGRGWPAVRVLRDTVNLGFAAAANRGAAAGHGEVVAFLNNDLRVEPLWLGRMVEALTTTGAAAAGSRILDWEGRHYDFGGAAMNFYGHGTNRQWGRPYEGDASDAPTPALFACGAAMVVDRARFLASGGFDPDYFAYFEDVDLGWRLWLEGARVVYVPGAAALHRHHGSGLAADERRRLLEGNALSTIVKNYDDANLAIVLPAALALLEVRAALASGGEAAIYRAVLEEFHERRAALEAKRAAVQARRRRADRDIVPLFLEPFRPSFPGRAYWREQRRVVRAFGVTRVFADTGGVALAEGLDHFVDELQDRIETLERQLADATASRAEGLRDLSIVIVTWHSAEDLPPLLASLQSACDAGAELVVVENGSGDGTPQLVRARNPRAVLIENRDNRGFAAAANQGLAASHGAYVLFLNPDTVVLDDGLARALASVAADPSIGIAGCRTLNDDGTPQPTVDRFHTVRGLVAEALVERRFGGRLRGRVPVASEDVDWVYGSFMLCRRRALAVVGGFDEAYEMYGEDIDLCHRARAAGYRVVYLDEATIAHRGNRSGHRRYGSDRDVEVLKGTLRFFRRRRGRGAELAFRALAGASFAAKALVHALRGLGPGGARAAARARLYARMAWLCASGDPAAANERGNRPGAVDTPRSGRLHAREVPGIERP